jgi:MYXO-CTERM domain-containing protein
MEVEPGAHPVAKQGPDRDQPRRHTFVGANVWGLDAVQLAAPGLDAGFAETRAAALRNLQAAAELTLVPPPGGLVPGVENLIKVRVTNKTGHKLPTGYADGRRVFIELSVGGQVVSGLWDGNTGVLVADPQLAVFEAVHGRADGGLHHLALHDTVIKDTRIPPLAFHPDEDTGPVGSPYLTDADGGVLGVAEWSYRVQLPSSADGGVSIAARLLYQSTTIEYVEALAAANGTDENGNQLRCIWEQTGRAAPVEMARSNVLVDQASEGCGCHSASGSAAVLPALAILVVWAFRRRRPPEA